MPNPFSTHHAAAGKAFKAGDHATAMHHIGHMMRTVKSASKPAPTVQPAAPMNTQPAPPLGASAEEMDQTANPLGIAPAPQRFAGQIAAKPKAVAPPTAPKGGFNKARFGAMKAKGK